ncbi:hypothetical protein J4437_05685 [Candidatus Woesearchaeota archaeon]|nr:hypothetical protein [Candidatus Woesearchaeota archaeon]
MEENVSLEDKLNQPQQKLPYEIIQHKNKREPNYSIQNDYLTRFRNEQKDLLKFIPLAHIDKFPKNGNEGLYGWTWRNKNGKVNLREDLTGTKKLEVDIHECCHTPDEYETRVLTAEIMKTILPEEKKYLRNWKDYN